MKKILKHTIVGFLLLGLITSCTDSFEDLNKNKIGIDEEQLSYDFNQIGAYFPGMQQMIYCNFNWGWGTDWTFQVMQNLNADIFSGYLCPATAFGGVTSDNRTYSYKPGWSDPAWDYTYAYMMPSTLIVKKESEKDYDFYGHFDAINKILKVTALARLSDIYGPVIYSTYGDSKTGGTYDSVEELYKNFFKDLDTAVQVLNAYVNAEETRNAKPFAKFDMAYGGDYVKWIQYANTLHLRLAMRIVKADPNLAKTEAEKAVKAAYGLIEDNSGNFTISGKGYFHPLTAIAKWGDTSISANVESILSGYQDPRLQAYALPVNAGEHIGQIKGMRQGIHNLAENKYVPGGDPLLYKISPPIHMNDNSMPAILLVAAETDFLRAEGVLRGWNMGGGTAKSYYESGITKSFSQWKVSLSDYFNSDKLPAAFIDQLQPATESSPAVSKVSPKWDDAASNEIKLEKIITQKWIAGFPEGYNAWAEYRRTGYPKLFPITNNTSGGAVPTETGFRRVEFSESEVSGNAEGVADAIKKLGGPDLPITRIWWDVNKANF